ncbi:MAG TPA: hypothetical protein VMH33_08510 [Solirubrobacterales bacterium]|nr:hypothetical protein [Solirubrobacterales bacterium]
MGHAKTKLLFLALFCLLGAPSSALASFGISTFTIAARNADGTIDTTAASHPFALDIHLAVNRLESGEPDGVIRTVQIDLPSGLLGNSSAVPRCPPVDFDGGHCDGATQIGILRGVVSGLGPITVPAYNLTPSPGQAAAFGSLIEGIPFVDRLDLRGPGNSSRLGITLPNEPAIVDVEEEIWGVPADSRHDSQRTCNGTCTIGTPEPFLTLPASCTEPMRATLTATSYGPPPATAVATAVTRGSGGDPQALLGCQDVPFEPRFSAATEAAALAPTSLKVDLEVAQHEGAESIGAAPVAGLKIVLPSGVALDPSAGSWLGGCSAAQIGLESSPGVEPAVFDESGAECPVAARLGSVTLQTPLVDHELGGAIYLAEPGENPYGARYAFYLVIEDPATGTILKIPGRLDADPSDGRLTATLPELPPLPFGKLELEFSRGPRAPLVAPPSCGKYSTEATLTPSTAPFGAPVTRGSIFSISTGPQGTACPPPEAQRGSAPSFQAGTENLSAGSDAALAIKLSRKDTDQHFGSFELTLPPGLVADLGTTPVGTEVGSARVEAGVGPEPLRLGGGVYLGGPYEGSPYSLEIVVPAHVGPFDLGTIVERVAVDVDVATAQISARADPLPQILEGVPLQLRGLRIDLDRPGFIRNPTSCEPMAITGTATTSLGQTAPISSSFQVGECAKLAFGPKLSLKFSGALGANGHPAVRATLRTNPEGAALKSASFTLPAGELLDLHHVRELCPRDAPVGQCPGSSRLGSLRLQSPFLDAPLEGPVYLRVPARRGLPDLSAELHSGGLSFVLGGRTTGSGGRLGVSLESLPDIPLSSAVLNLAGGRRGIVVNSSSLCGKRGSATASFSAHNGMSRRQRIRLQTQGC